MTRPLTRREFVGALGIGLIAGVVYFASPYIKRLTRDEPAEVELARLLMHRDDPKGIVTAFAQAPSAHLMGMYAIFFPQFMIAHGKAAADVLAEAVREVQGSITKDLHRLEALPAAAAAHLLGELKGLKNEDVRDSLCDRVARTLGSPNREIKEIVLQNLIASTWPNFDNRRYYTVSEQLLAQGDKLIEDAAETDKLLSPLCLYAQFIASYRKLLSTREYKPQYFQPLDKQMQRIKQLSEKVPHLWYARRTIELYERTTITDPKFALPQRSEALMGWRKLYSSNPETYDLLQHFAIIHYRNAFAVHKAASGVDLSYQVVMSQQQAQRAFPKAASFVQTFTLDRLVAGLETELTNVEPAFGQWLTEGYLDRYELPAEFASTVQDEKGIASTVPFSQWEPKTAPLLLLQEADLERHELIRAAPARLAQGLAITGGVFALLRALLERRHGAEKGEDYARELEPHSHRITEEVARHTKDVDSRLGEKLDQQQEELGPPPDDSR